MISILLGDICLLGRSFFQIAKAFYMGNIGNNMLLLISNNIYVDNFQHTILVLITLGIVKQNHFENIYFFPIMCSKILLSELTVILLYICI